MSTPGDFKAEYQAYMKEYPYSFVLKVIPAKTELNLLLKKSDGFLTCESPENQVYGKGFYETVAMVLRYKQRFIHSVKCVYYMKDCLSVELRYRNRNNQ